MRIQPPPPRETDDSHEPREAERSRGRVRPLRIEDLPAFSELSQQLFRDEVRQLPRGAGRCCLDRRVAYFRELFFGNPWFDQELTSLVYEATDGRAVAFLGVIPRTMRLGTERIRVATSTEYIVHPDARSPLAAVELLRTFLNGPQDLSIADNANEASRRLWTALGGQVASLYSVPWYRKLRPCRFAVDALSDDLGLGEWVPRLTAPVTAMLDAISRRLPGNRALRPDADVTTEPLDVDALIACMARFSADYSLRAEFDRDSLAWLLRMAQQRQSGGPWRIRGVRWRRDEMIGAYIYYCGIDGWVQVVHVFSAPAQLPIVLAQLARDARRDGAIGISGRADPGGLLASSLRYTTVRWPHRWMLYHSRRADVLSAIVRGNALLTRLDGEWWICAHELTEAEPPGEIPIGSCDAGNSAPSNRPGGL